MPQIRDINSNVFGVVLVTIPDPAASISPDSQACRDCVVQQRSGTQAYVDYITCAEATGWKMGSGAQGFPVDNLNELHFFGTAGDVVQILWRN